MKALSVNSAPEATFDKSLIKADFPPMSNIATNLTKSLLFNWVAFVCLLTQVVWVLRVALIVIMQNVCITYRGVLS